MSVIKEKIKVNGRLITNALIDKSNTFLALCELIDNSIQAKANLINIYMENNSNTEMIKDSISFLSITDNGFGVSYSDFPKKILEIATDVKPKGKGRGRFSVFQFGRTAYFETISYDEKLKKYTKTYCTLKLSELQDGYIDKDLVDVFSEELNSEQNTYFKIEITDIFDKNDIDYNKRKNKINESLRTENIGLALFTRYPIEMLDKNISFIINNIKINPKNYEIERYKENSSYNKYKINYDIIEHISNKKKEEKTICIRTENNNIKNILNYCDIEMNIPYKERTGIGWHIYIDSDYIDENLEYFEHLDLKDMNVEVSEFFKQIEYDIENFFLSKHKEYFDFKEKLIKNNYYPYNEKNPSSSQIKELAFIQIAYFIEQKYKLLTNKEQIASVIYPLLNGCLDSPNLQRIINNINTLEKKDIDQFNDLLEKTELNEVITFADDIAHKMAFLEFLYKINYGDISKYILERKQLHKIVEKELWIFGEDYAYNNHILKSDKNLGDNLKAIRDEIYKLDSGDILEDISENEETQKIKDITDLFLYKDFKYSTKHEVLIVELKRPNLKLGDKEIEQVKKYGAKIAKSPSISKKNVNFKIILIGSSINEDTKLFINDGVPFFQSNGIEIWIMSWADLIKENKDKLTYMSKEIKTKDNYILDNIKKEFPEINFDNIQVHLKPKSAKNI